MSFKGNAGFLSKSKRGIKKGNDLKYIEIFKGMQFQISSRRKSRREIKLKVLESFSQTALSYLSNIKDITWRSSTEEADLSLLRTLFTLHQNLQELSFCEVVTIYVISQICYKRDWSREFCVSLTKCIKKKQIAAGSSNVNWKHL